MIRRKVAAAAAPAGTSRGGGDGASVPGQYGGFSRVRLAAAAQTPTQRSSSAGAGPATQTASATTSVTPPPPSCVSVTPTGPFLPPWSASGRTGVYASRVALYGRRVLLDLGPLLWCWRDVCVGRGRDLVLTELVGDGR